MAGAAYGTHITPLIAAVLATNGDVLELGMGDYSTPLLHEIIGYQRKSGSTRKLLSAENDAEWLANYIDLKTKWHFILHVKDWDAVITPAYLYSVVFIDHAPAEQRAKDIIKFKEVTEIFVVHDTDKMEYYGYEEAFSQFKYRFTYERYRKSTTLLSNTIDVTKLL